MWPFPTQYHEGPRELCGRKKGQSGQETLGLECWMVSQKGQALTAMFTQREIKASKRSQ